MFHYPVIISGLILIAILAKYSFKNFNALRSLGLIFILMSLILVFQVVSQRGFVILSGGGYIVFLGITFSCFFSFSYLNEMYVIRWFNFIYIFIILTLYIEMFILFCGGQPFLTEMLRTTESAPYKHYNGADLLRAMGFFEDTGGMNSILLGSQISGMLSLFSYIWFRWQYSLVSSSLNIKTWTYLSLFMLLLTLNATIFIMIFCYKFIYYYKYFRKHFFSTILIFIVILSFIYLLIIEGFLFSRIFGSHEVLGSHHISQFSQYGHDLIGIGALEYYLFSFLNPIHHWYAAELPDKLFGVGVPFFLRNDIYISGDFGFATDVLLKVGLIWSIIFLFVMLHVCYSCIKIAKMNLKNYPITSTILHTNSVIIILWLVSMIHYNQAMQNPACMMLFSLNLAISVFFKKKLSSYTVFNKCNCLK